MYSELRQQGTSGELFAVSETIVAIISRQEEPFEDAAWRAYDHSRIFAHAMADE